MSNRKTKGFGKRVVKGAAKGLGKLAKSAVNGVVGELASIFTLGLYRRPRRRH